MKIYLLLSLLLTFVTATTFATCKGPEIVDLKECNECFSTWYLNSFYNGSDVCVPLSDWWNCVANVSPKCLRSQEDAIVECCTENHIKTGGCDSVCEKGYDDDPSPEGSLEIILLSFSMFLILFTCSTILLISCRT